MDSGKPREVLDLYTWLPPYGESGIEVRLSGLEWVIEISYEEISTQRLLRRPLTFTGVSAVYQSAFPGAAMLKFTTQGKDKLGSLVEYPESPVAKEWEKHWGDTQCIKHYRVIFLAENQSFQVFAERVTLGEPIRP